MKFTQRVICALLAVVMVFDMLPAIVARAEEVQKATSVEEAAVLTATEQTQAVYESTTPLETVTETAVEETTEITETVPEEAIVEFISSTETACGIASGTCGSNLTWTLDESGTLTISGNGEIFAYMMDNFPWSDIRNEITAIVIEEGVVGIPTSAFSGCWNATSLVLPDSLAYIDSYAFERCEKLTEVTIPGGVKELGGSAFQECFGLQNVVISEGVTVIGSNAFQATGMTSLLLPETLKTIGCGSFAYCYNLKSVSIPDSVTSIGDRAFDSCGNLQSLYIPSSVTEISGYLGTIGEEVETAFLFCEVDSKPEGWVDSWYGVSVGGAINGMGLSNNEVNWGYSKEEFDYWIGLDNAARNIEIPDGYEKIPHSAFWKFTELTSVSIPNSVKEIGKYAFAGCAKLDNIVIPDSVSLMGPGVFYACSSLERVQMPESLTELGENFFYDCGELTEVILPEGIRYIGDSAFYNCANLTEISIPDGVASIGRYAFYNCSTLAQAALPDSLNEIGEFAFYGCSKLCGIDIPEGVAAIGDNTFYECAAMTCAVLPESLDTIGNCAFYGCSALVELTLPTQMTSIGWEAFRNCSSLTRIELPDGITLIGDRTFENCTSLNCITIPESVTEIGDYAFYYCSNLAEVHISDLRAWCEIQFATEGTWYAKAASPTMYGADLYLDGEIITELVIPEGVTAVSACGFEGCKSLTSVVIPEGVTSIGLDAFYGCSNIISVEIPQSVTHIGDRAFGRCGNLETVTLPAGLETISECLFEQCKKITSIVIPEGVTDIGTSAFYSCRGLTSITIPASVASIGQYAFDSCSYLREIIFEGDAPSIDTYTFQSTRAKAYYPMNNPTWTENMLQSYGGELTWGVICSGEHTIVTIPAVAPTCTTAGLSEGKGCSVCDYVFEEPATLAPLGHVYKHTICRDCGYERPTGGEVGNNLFWSIDYVTGILTVWGCDFMTDFNYGKLYIRSVQPAAAADSETTTIKVTDSAVGSSEADADNETPWLQWRDDIKEIVIQEGVKSIGKYAFADCANLEKVSLPGSVVSIGYYAFSKCKALTEVEFAGAAPEVVNAYAFRGVSATVKYPKEDDSWTEEKLNNYGGKLTWSPVYPAADVIQISADKTVLQPGESAVLTVTLNQEDENAQILWTLEEEYAELTDNGITAKITAKNVTQKQIITVKAKTAEGLMEGVSLQITILPLAETIRILDDCHENVSDSVVVFNTAHKDSITFWAEVLPEDAPDTVTWNWNDRGRLWASYQDNGDGSFTIRNPKVKNATITLTATTGNLSSKVTVKLVGLVVEKEENEEENAADVTLFAGSSKTLRVYDQDTGKALTAKQIQWSLPEEYASYAALTAAGKLTAKKVMERVRIEAIGTILGSEGVQVIATADIFPALTQVEILEDGEVVNGKTVTMDFDEESRTFTAWAYPLDTVQDVIWTISDAKKEAFAEYAIEGNALTVTNLTGKVGTVTVKATVNAGTKKTVSFKLSFANFAEKVEITNTEETITAGSSLQLSAVVTPENVTKSGVNWSLKNAADKAYASVSAKGLLKAKTVYGETHVTVVATSKDGLAKDEHTVIIQPKDAGILILKHGDKNVTKGTVNVDMNNTMTVHLTAENFGNGIKETVEWKSSKAAIATVENGTVTFVKTGTVTITAVAADGRKATVTIKATQLASKVSITGAGEVASGKTVTLKATVESAASSKVTWAITSGAEYAKITKNGKLTANKDITSAKEVTIRATAADGSGIYGETTVTIRPIAQGVQIYSQQGGRTLFSVRTSDRLWARSNTTLEWAMNESKTLQLSSCVYPSYSEDSQKNAIQGVTWKSSSNKIATVDENGLVTCLKSGTVTITATAKDGSGKNATFKLKVIQKVESLYMADQKVAGGKSLNLAKLIQVGPNDATYKTFTWEIIGGNGVAYASINAKGVLKTKKVRFPADVVITATAQDGSGVSVSFTVTISP